MYPTRSLFPPVGLRLLRFFLFFFRTFLFAMGGDFGAGGFGVGGFGAGGFGVGGRRRRRQTHVVSLHPDVRGF